MEDKMISVAVDGPAGAGKSTIARKVADRLNIVYIDTGAMFRAITYKILKNNIDINDKLALKDLLASTVLNFKDNNIILDGHVLDGEIRKNYISTNVSDIAKIKEVRDKMLVLQREIAKKESVIMDGRDIGSVVLPDATHKFYITADTDIRARRRYEELLEKGEVDMDLKRIEEEIILRDEIDMNREIAPLIESDDSIRIDNSYRSIEESVCDIIDIIKSEEYVI